MIGLGLGLSLGAGGKAAGPKPIASPSAYFDWFADMGLSVSKSAAAYSTNYTLEMFKPAVTGITIYVDYATGDNANNGLSWGAAKKTLSGAASPINAASASQVHRVLFKGGLSSTAGVAQFSRSVVIESFDGGRLKNVNSTNNTPISWTKTGGEPMSMMAHPPAQFQG